MQLLPLFVEVLPSFEDPRDPRFDSRVHISEDPEIGRRAGSDDGCTLWKSAANSARTNNPNLFQSDRRCLTHRIKSKINCAKATKGRVDEMRMFVTWYLLELKIVPSRR
jgi:hypothetical protein